MCHCAVHPASLQVEQLLRDCELRLQRRRGPGGQHRNKVETGVVIRHRPTGVEAEGSERRSQRQNRQMAVRRLRIRLAVAVRAPIRDGRGPSPLWQSRCRGGRVTISPRHDDYPALLAEALDVVMAAGADLVVAAKQLGCTRSQLTRFLKTMPEAFRQVNRLRVGQGRRPLK